MVNPITRFRNLWEKITGSKSKKVSLETLLDLRASYGNLPNSIAPWVPSPLSVVKKMLEFTELEPGEVLYDLGCGDGRIVIVAARDFDAIGMGVDIRAKLIDEAKSKAESLGLGESAKFVQGDLFDVDLRSVDVVTMYLLTSANEKVRPKLEKELHLGARIVTHDFPIPGWKPKKQIDYSDESGSHQIYLYVR